MERQKGQLIQHHLAARRVGREAGFAFRKDVPLEGHEAMPEMESRGHPIEILTEQDEAPLQHLVPIRHGQMSVSPFTFYRGSAAVQAPYLSNTPTTDFTVQVCGDAHLSNFGLFNGPDRRLVFDLNDFDETHPRPFEWDGKRLAASVAVAGRNNESSPEKINRAVLAAVAGYRQAIWQCSHKAAAKDSVKRRPRGAMRHVPARRPWRHRRETPLQGDVGTQGPAVARGAD